MFTHRKDVKIYIRNKKNHNTHNWDWRILKMLILFLIIIQNITESCKYMGHNMYEEFIINILFLHFHPFLKRINMLYNFKWIYNLFTKYPKNKTYEILLEKMYFMLIKQT